MASLIRLAGGRDAFIARLDKFFDEKLKLFQPSNEPGFLVPYHYHYVGRPDKSVKVIRDIISRYYSLSRTGLPGNDDSGAMASWLVFGLLGIFPVAGQDVYLIGSPHFRVSTISLDSTSQPAKVFSIIAHNLSRDAIYVQRARLNGVDLHRNWFSHAEAFVNGGILELWMGKEPSDWGTLPSSVPPSYRPDSLV
jgi:putative alpha-1,2-mannosidase